MSANDDLGITIPANRPANVDELAATIKAQPAPRSAPSVIAQQPEGANPDALVPFVFGDEIARGGMGSILKAEDCKLGRTIAVKIMLSELNTDEDQKQRFINEAAVLAKLEHPNVVPIHDIGRDSEGQLYYTMKLVKGRTLQAIINDLRNEGVVGCQPSVPSQSTVGRLPTTPHYSLAHLLTIFRKVCDAMAFAHSQGIIHRDLKPDNIMVGEFGEVLVMDWGLAKTLKDEGGRLKDEKASSENSSFILPPSSLTATLQGAVMGTPQYMSPEQAEGRIADMDARSDIFSLGGILYCILTLRPPIEGKTLDEVLQKVISGTITPLTSKGTTALLSSSQGGLARRGAGRRSENIPPALSAVTMKALTLARERRYQNVAALSEDIESYQGGFATSAENAGAWKQFTLLVRRNKATSIGVAALLLVSIGFTAKVIAEGRRAERGEAAARATLADLRRTAPIFYSQAKVVFDEGDFEQAIEKLGYAIDLDGDKADYHLFRANLRQSSQDLAVAAEGYDRVLALRPADAAAKTNLALCEKLLRESGGAPLGRPQQGQLLAALRAQKRLVEAAPLAALIDPDIAIAKAALEARLREFRNQPGWKAALRVEARPDGTFKVNLHKLQPGDLSVLKGQPVTVLLPGESADAGLNGLAGLPLKELNLHSAKAADLSPLRGMPLESLDLNSTPVTDLSPLRGMKLNTLNLAGTGVSDLSPLAGMPLSYLSCGGSRQVSDLSPLRDAPLVELILTASGVTSLAPLAGAPLKRLDLNQTTVADLTPLAQCVDLDELVLGTAPVTDLAPLAKLHLTKLESLNPKLTSIAPLRGQPLRILNLKGTGVTDLSPLAKCTTLEELYLPTTAGDLSMLRKLPRLRFISTRTGSFVGKTRPSQTAEEFWKEYDAKQAAGKK